MAFVGKNTVQGPIFRQSLSQIPYLLMEKSLWIDLCVSVSIAPARSTSSKAHAGRYTLGLRSPYKFSNISYIDISVLLQRNACYDIISRFFKLIFYSFHLSWGHFEGNKRLSAKRASAGQGALWVKNHGALRNYVISHTSCKQRANYRLVRIWPEVSSADTSGCSYLGLTYYYLAVENWTT